MSATSQTPACLCLRRCCVHVDSSSTKEPRDLFDRWLCTLSIKLNVSENVLKLCVLMSSPTCYTKNPPKVIQQVNIETDQSQSDGTWRTPHAHLPHPGKEGMLLMWKHWVFHSFESPPLWVSCSCTERFGLKLDWLLRTSVEATVFGNTVLCCHPLFTPHCCSVRTNKVSLYIWNSSKQSRSNIERYSS